MMMPSLPLSAASLVAASSQDVSRDAHHVPLGAVRGLLTPRPHRRMVAVLQNLAQAHLSATRPAAAPSQAGEPGPATGRGLLSAACPGAAPSQVFIHSRRWCRRPNCPWHARRGPITSTSPARKLPPTAACPRPARPRPYRSTFPTGSIATAKFCPRPAWSRPLRSGTTNPDNPRHWLLSVACPDAAPSQVGRQGFLRRSLPGCPRPFRPLPHCRTFGRGVHAEKTVRDLPDRGSIAAP